MTRRKCRLGVAALLMGCALTGCAAGQAPAPPPLDETFNGPDAFITSGAHPADNTSPWVMTSGSLFRSGNEGWSGPIERRTGSAVFRMVSKRHDFADIDLGARIQPVQFGTTPKTPAQDYDGIHVWVRYRSEYELYAVSVDRRDGVMIIKKKCPGGSSNGGTYYDLTQPLADTGPALGRWQQVRVSVRDEANGSVRITAQRDRFSMVAVDDGVGCAPLRGPGAVGFRGDNTELRLADVHVDPR